MTSKRQTEPTLRQKLSWQPGKRNEMQIVREKRHRSVYCVHISICKGSVYLCFRSVIVYV